MRTRCAFAHLARMLRPAGKYKVPVAVAVAVPSLACAVGGRILKYRLG